MHLNTLNALIPVPKTVIPAEGHFPVTELGTIAFPASAAKAAEKLTGVCTLLKADLEKVASAASADLVFKHTASIPAEGWKLVITPKKITLSASGNNGFLYGTGALIQMLVIALREGPSTAYLDCGTVEDSPRFPWRGFLLDSSRHFQTPDTVKDVLTLLAEFRINSFHWHLSDNQGWRFISALAPEAAGRGTRDDGCYTREEITDIIDHARSLGIRIIPELDIPGHSAKILSLRPEFACDPKHPGQEFCIGSKKARTFLKKMLDEVMELFPDSPIIHIGGDEAETTAWEKCPVCRKALKDKKLNTFRELENEFMQEMADYVLSKKRTPVIWSCLSGQKYSPDVIIQVWHNLREPIFHAANGNKTVYSVHSSLYLDYPADLSEAHENWMYELSDQGVYMTEPYMIWPEKVKDSILGTESCLWTEIVPEWRVMRKIMPRLPAYAECAWTLPEKKEYHDFARRRDELESAGYFDILRDFASFF